MDAAVRRLMAENERLKKEMKALEEALRGALDQAQQLETLAYRDSLTGLPNRRSLGDRFHGMLSTGVPQPFAVLLVDLDNFKRINESLGHGVADDLLRELATALDDLIRTVDASSPLCVAGSRAVRPDGVLSRLGGDEFVILLPRIADRAAAESIAARIIELLERPFRVGSRSIVVTASIGIALYPADGHTADTLVANADAAMYAAKRRGKACYEHYRGTAICMAAVRDERPAAVLKK
jgi:GGDEF domain-containing protein